MPETAVVEYEVGANQHSPLRIASARPRTAGTIRRRRAMAKYEVILVKYPELESPDNLWWTALCPAMQGCVSDGQTREEALMMIADAMAGHLEEEPGWIGVVYDEDRTKAERDATIAECREEGGVTEIHWVEPRYMTEDEVRDNRHLESVESPIA